MAKAGIIEEMMSDAMEGVMDGEDMEEETDEQVGQRCHHGRVQCNCTARALAFGTWLNGGDCKQVARVRQVEARHSCAASGQGGCVGVFVDRQLCWHDAQPSPAPLPPCCCMQIDKILLEVAGETLSQMAAAPRQQKQALQQQQAAEEEEGEELQARLAAVKS